MGLMNVGRSEGSEIIQLFGRGVRLKGFQYSLKRSSALDASYNPGNLPKGLREIETLNIFGVRADYRNQDSDGELVGRQKAEDCAPQRRL